MTSQRRRIAYCSPVNPVGSGISDYSEELLPFLAQYVDITLVVDDPVKPANPELARHFPIERVSRLVKAHRRQPFDAIIYHMGNSEAHSGFWAALQQLPGIVVLHDYVLHHLMIWHAANALKDLRVYREAMRRRYGEAGARIAAQMERGQLSDAVFEFPLAEDVLERATGLIAHSGYVRDRAAAIRPDLPAAVVPMGVPLPPPPDRRAARAAIGLPEAAPIWASFGHVNPYKRIEQALRAFRAFLAEQPDARYVLVGSVSPNYNLAGLIGRLGLGEAVAVTGHVSAEDFMRYVAAADLCFNGRYPSAGETSASLLRLLGAGRAVLVSDVATFGELPGAVAAHVPVDRDEEALILAYARRLLGEPALREALEANARAYVAREHTLAGAAAGYARFLFERHGWGEPAIIRPPLWDPAPPAPPPSAA
ncbi:MAG TPA: glycosyltransferase family 4 protein, partial [Herpetosiphonaceae bacterium]